MTDFEKGSLIMLCAVIIFVVIFLIFILIFIKKQEKNKKNVSNEIQKAKLGVPYEDIKKFLPFDDIKDNMIIEEKGDRYTMMVECEGINYDLMSDAEKISVEEGFIQFLNSIRYPIQIYVQTRTVDLSDSIATYNERLSKQQDEFNHLLSTFQELDNQGASSDKLLEVGYLLEKKEKVLNYTKDLIDNVAIATQNSNVLRKKYFIAVSYHTREMGLVNNFEMSEIARMANIELNNRAESIRGGISSCGIESHILDTTELAEVMYVAVNRDEADIFSMKKIIDSDISAISITAKDVMFKKQELLKEQKRAQEIEAQKEVEARRMAARRQEAENLLASKGVDSSTIL